MSGAEVLRIVLRDFGLVSHEDLRRGALAAADVPQLLDTLEGFLQSLAPIGSHAVIVLDEAQSLPPQTLDQIRLLTGLEHQGHRLVQVVLCGQTALLTTLKSEALSALNERITRRVEVGPLPPDQVEGYIQHRLAVAGGANAVSFDTAAARAIADLSRGVPRRINVLCDRSLQEGRIEGVHVITADLVKRAARALAGVHDPIPVAPVAPPKPSAPAKPAPPPKPAPPKAEEPAKLAAPPRPPASASREPISAPALPDAPVAPAMASAAAPTALFEAEQTAAVESAPAFDSPGLMFGQTEAPAPRAGKKKTIVLVAAGIAVAAAAGYAAYARSVPDPVSVIPDTPPPTVYEAGLPAEPLPVPTAEEIATINEMFPPARRAPATPEVLFPNGGGPLSADPAAGVPADPPEAPPAGQPDGPPPASTPLPNDSDQVN
jgi:general secretion pathway protein A